MDNFVTFHQATLSCGLPVHAVVWTGRADRSGFRLVRVSLLALCEAIALLYAIMVSHVVTTSAAGHLGLIASTSQVGSEDFERAKIFLDRLVGSPAAGRVGVEMPRSSEP